MKLRLTLLLACLLNLAYARGITYDDPQPTRIFSLGYGLNSTNYALKGVSVGLMVLRSYENEGGLSLVSLSYAKRISKRGYVGMSMALDQQHGEWQRYFTLSSLSNMQRETLGIFNRTCATIAIEYRNNYFVQEKYMLYAVLGAGATLYHEVRQYSTDRYMQGYTNGVNMYGTRQRFTTNSAYPNIYISPIGIMAGGGKWRYFLEAGVGYKGLLHGGVNYTIE